MDILKALSARRSTKAALLCDPAPDDATLMEILQTGMSAPDHGAIHPWRFTVIKGDQRQKLADTFAEALLLDKPDADQDAIDKIKSKPFRAPLIVTIWAEVNENHPKVPPLEQIVSTSMATENIMLAAAAKEVGAVLLTGWPAFHSHVKKFLGMAEKDQIIGFLYMGTITETPREMSRPDVSDFMRPLQS